MSRRNRFGLVLLGLLAVADLFTPLMTDGDHPPMEIAIGGAVVGRIRVAREAVGVGAADHPADRLGAARGAGVLRV